MDSDDLGEIGILVVVLYLMLASVATYPALVVGYYTEEYFGYDESLTVGFWVWLITIGMLVLLKMLQQYVILLVIYLLTLVPFILLCIKWYKECNGG